MSFIIKGFDTDGNCLHCYFQSEDSDRCILTDDDIPLYGKGHPDSCPLIPLPAGHGRLGDLDRLEGFLRTLALYQSGERQQGILGCCETIKVTPTIVPAEGGNADGD